MNKIEKILIDINNTKVKTLKENISERLNKTLELYVYELNRTYNSAVSNDPKKVIKELSK